MNISVHIHLCAVFKSIYKYLRMNRMRLQWKSIKQWYNHQLNFEGQGSATLLMITDAYLAMDDSGDC